MTGAAGAADEPAGRACFSDVQRVLALFAQGLTGHHLHLKPRAEPPAPGHVRFPIDGKNDGMTIHLPAEIAYFPSDRHNLGAYRIAVLHQIGYLENGTFDFDLATAATLMDLPRPPSDGPGLRWLPVRQVPDLERFFAAGHRPALLRRVFATLEDLRVDTAMRRRYPGARADLDRVLAHALAARPDMETLRPLAALLEALVRFSLGAAPGSLPAHDGSGLRQPMLDAAGGVLARTASVYDSARAALEVCALLEGLIRRSPRTPGTAAPTLASHTPGGGDLPGADSDGPAQQGAADEDAEPVPDDFDGPGVEFRGELIPALPHGRQQGGQAGTAPVTPSTLTPVPVPAPASGQGAGNAATPSSRPHPALARQPASREVRSFLYDEWDYHAQGYLRAWCRLYEYRLRGDDFGFIDGVRRRHAALARRVKRSFSLIRPESWHRVHRVSDGDEFELDAVIEAFADRRAGHVSDEHLYVRRDRARREVAAAFLADMSASTDYPIADPDAARAAPAPPADQDLYLYRGLGDPPDAAPPGPQRRVIDIAKEALALMCDALRTLGDSHAIYGFSGDGREKVEFHVAKDFGDAVSARTWAALAAMQPRRSTRMGPAIRHAVAKLARQPVRRRVLIIVSDGYPEDHDYGPDRRDREYGIQDTARALREAERAGVSTFCVTIDPAGHDYLRRMCAADRYMVIADVAALPGELTKVYRALTV